MPPSVVCCGMSRSGSTWLYNVVQAFRPDMTGLYCETEKALPASLNGVLIKCHGPDDAMIARIRAENIPVILTVRDPRDVAVSFMDCFNESLSAAMDTLPLCAGPIVKLADYAALILRYEDDFPHDIRSVEAVAKIVGSTLAVNANDVLAKLHRDSVRAEVERLERDVFDPALGPAQHDPISHWHPRHIGDAAIGKHASRLTHQQQDEVLERTRAYCDLFGYS